MSWLPLLFTSFDRTADHYESTGAAGDRTLDQQHAVLAIDLVHQQVLHGHLVATHAAGHPRALEHARGSGAAADRAGTAMHCLSTMAGALAAEAVALHGAREALALGSTGHVDVAAV